MTNESTTKQIDVYQVVTDRIIAMLEQGTVPWRKPWKDRQPPQNLVTGNRYRGVNALLLGSMDYQRNLFLTFKQAKELGATIRKGEKSLPVVYWNWTEKEDPKTKEIKKRAFLRYYNVFNVAQCDGVPEKLLPPLDEREHKPIEECEAIVANLQNGPTIEHGGNSAFYNPQSDAIKLPEPGRFESEEEYYLTLFHELVHSSGHASRLNRKEVVDEIAFGSEEYAIEELTAEIGATFLRSQTGIDVDIENNAAYIEHWLKRLQNDKKFIVRASAQAQRASEYILNERQLEAEVGTPEAEIEEQPPELRVVHPDKSESISR